MFVRNVFATMQIVSKCEYYNGIVTGVKYAVHAIQSKGSLCFAAVKARKGYYALIIQLKQVFLLKSSSYLEFQIIAIYFA